VNRPDNNFGTDTTMLTNPDTNGISDNSKFSLVLRPAASRPTPTLARAARGRRHQQPTALRVDGVRQALTSWDETSATFNTRNGVNLVGRRRLQLVGLQAPPAGHDRHQYERSEDGQHGEPVELPAQAG
jgi:hypothetical protein